MNKKFGILGLGKTGVSCFKYLQNIASTLVCWDDNLVARQIFSDKFSLDHLVSLDQEVWRNLDYIIASPGIPLKGHRVANFDVPIIGDIDLLYLNNPNSKFIAITGTNGKSTTTALTGHILQDFIVCGNIGMPVLEAAQNRDYVLELSSYQIDLMTYFKPDIAVILNITPDHLDRYLTMENYIASKLSIAKNMDKAGYLLINLDDDLLRSCVNSFPHTRVLTFSLQNPAADFVYGEHNFSSQLIGKHNLYNILAAFAASILMDESTNKVLDRISSFKGLKHRLEFIGKFKNINFYNDSKSTNKESSIVALNSLSNVFWLAGGIPKDGGINGLDTRNVHKAYFFGAARFEFAQYVQDAFIAETLAGALEKAFQDAQNFKGEANILLSPACSSFDQFKDFEDRGQHFNQLVSRYVDSSR